MAKLGRPTVYDPKYCEMLIDHMAEGLSFESFGGVIGVHKDTLFQWVKKHEEFADSKKIATEKSRIFWERLAIDNLINKSDSETNSDKSGWSKSRSLNATTWIFNMKNRFGWRDKSEVQETSDVKITIEKQDEEL